MTVGHDLRGHLFGIPSRNQNALVVAGFGVEIHVVEAGLATILRFFDGLGNVQVDTDEVPFVLRRGGFEFDDFGFPLEGEGDEEEFVAG